MSERVRPDKESICFHGGIIVWPLIKGPRVGSMSPGLRAIMAAAHVFRGGEETFIALRVQSTQIQGMGGFYARNRKNGVWNILCIWATWTLGVD